MGGVQSQQRLGFIFDDYQLIGEESQLKILQDKTTQQTFALKEQCFANRKQYDHCFKRLTNRNQNHDCQNVLRLTKLWSKEHNGICSNLFKIYTVYQYPKVKLIDQIEARNKEKKYFEQVELFSILQSCINALTYEPRYVNVSPHLIFIIPEGVLKLIHIDLIDQNLRTVYNPKYYYSPEKIEQFQNQSLQSSTNLEKQSVFCLGMTILHSALLQNPNFCYEISNKRINKRKIELLLSQLSSIYSENLYEILSAMLEMNPNQRITFDGLQDYINNYFGNQSVLLKSSANESKSNLHEEKFQQAQIEHNYQAISSENKAKEQSSSLAYSGDTFFKAPSLSLKNDTNFKNIKKSELQVMMELSSSENSNLPKNHYILQKTKKSKVKNTSEKQNDFNQKALIDTQKNQTYINTSKNIACSKDLLSQYEFNSENKDRCIFVIQSYQDGSRYQGMMQNNQKNGYGKLVYQDGVYYEGNFKNDCIHGKGTLYYGMNRPAYCGDWISNKFNGKGTLYNQFPAHFSGTFDYRNFNKIEERWIKFQGHFVNDVKEGMGKIYLTNGETMQGHFSKGLLNGEGFFMNIEGGRVEAAWKNNLII